MLASWLKQFGKHRRSSGARRRKRRLGPMLVSEALEPRNLLTLPLGVIEVTETTSDIVYDPTRDVIWASVPDQNLIGAIDPNTGVFTPAVNTAAPVDAIAISDDGSILWTATNVLGRVNRIDLNTQTILPDFGIYDDNLLTVQDIEALPGSNTRAAIAGNGGPMGETVIMFTVTGTGTGILQNVFTGEGNNLVFRQDGSVAYTFDSNTAVTNWYTVTASGLGPDPLQRPGTPFFTATVQSGTGDIQYAVLDIVGTATAVSAINTLTDSNAVFDTTLVGRTVTITAGEGEGQTRTITGVSQTQLTLNQAWTIPIDTTSEYLIERDSVYFDSGQVVDVHARVQTGAIPLIFPQVPSAVDEQSYFVDGMGTVHVVSLETNLEIDQVPLLMGFTVNGTPTDPIRLADDSNLLAYRTPDQVFIVKATEFAPQCDTVVQSGEAGFGTLRQAIQCANEMPGIQRIRFDGLGGIPFNIFPTSPLPTITDEVVIDGTTNPGFTATPLVVINGSKAGATTDGLTFAQGATGSIVDSIAVNSFGGDGMLIRGSNLTITNTWVGTDATGSANLGNGENGIRILNSQGNTITGSVVSGNVESGIAIEGATSTGNVVTNTLIGTDSTGATRIRNRDTGVEIAAATGNTIGPNNVISGSKRGVRIRQGATANSISGNFIGTDITGTSSIRNTRGISLEDSDGNSIGPGNVISGNTNGVFFSRSDSNLVQGNMLGTNPAGTVAVPNTRGVQINSSKNNMIGGGNVISGNLREGVRITRVDSIGNTIQGNMIGTNAAGDTALPNRTGVWMTNTAGPNEVGGRVAGEGNTISGNRDFGVQLYSSGHVVEGNRIGTDLAGAAAIANDTGVFIRSASVNTIGGTVSGARNLISGNTEEGVSIVGAAAASNLVQGNYIGTDVTGVTALPNKNGVVVQAPSNTIGGPSSVAGNLISGNTLDGVTLKGADATKNLVQGNRIGVGNNIPNAAPIAEVESNDTQATAQNIDGIGWGLAADPNIANATTRPHITVNGMGDNTIDNYSFTVINAGDVGVFDIDATTAGFDSIITLYNAAGNVVRQNNDSLLTDGAGGSASTGDSFIQITFSAPGRYVLEVDMVGGGGVPAGATYQLQASIDNHSVVGLPNNRGGVLIEDAPANTIGGTIAGAANVISGNNLQGVKVVGTGSKGNTIEGNFIGVNSTGQGVPNGDGVRVADGAERTMIGGSAAGAANVIATNVRRGVFVTAATTNGSSVSRNSIHNNGDLGILLGTANRTPNDPDDPDAGANNLQNFPELDRSFIGAGQLNIDYSVPSTTVNSAYPLTVEFFKTDGVGQEGRTFIGADTYTAPGTKTVMIPVNSIPGGVPGGTRIVATATDANGNTSEFSDPLTYMPLLAADGEVTGGTAASLTASQLNGLLGAAVSRLNDAGLASGLFSQVEVTIGDLPGAMLGLAAGNMITIDIDAAGHGWFVDSTPLDDAEFDAGSRLSTLDSQGQMDLLTVVMHELGHTAGLADRYEAGSEDDLMYGWLEAGLRRTSLAASLADGAFEDF